MTHKKGANLLQFYVEKQVFLWRAKKVQICYIITWKSRFSHYTPERCSLLHYYVEKHDFAWRDRKQSVHFVSKQVFSWRAKTLILDAYYVATQVFSWRAKTPHIWCIYTWKRKVFSWRDRKQSVHLMHYYVEKQVLSWRAKNSYIWCINTCKSRFSHDATENKVYIWCNITFRSRFSRDATKTLIFDALLRGKAGFLMMRQKGANLLHYYVEKQVYPWHAKNINIWCIYTWKSRFCHDAPKRFSFVALLRGKAGFMMMRQ